LIEAILAKTWGSRTVLPAFGYFGASSAHVSYVHVSCHSGIRCGGNCLES